jgi:hypothetical protein
MKITIGRYDKADFPEFKLFAIDIKIDSGAYTSSIHCTKITEVVINGEECLKFTLLDGTHSSYNDTEFITKNYTSKLVKSSNGISEERFLINTTIVLFNQSFSIDLTLTERSGMKFPVLLGRKFLNDKFIIDTSLKNLSSKHKK